MTSSPTEKKSEVETSSKREESFFLAPQPKLSQRPDPISDKQFVSPCVDFSSPTKFEISPKLTNRDDPFSNLTS